MTQSVHKVSQTEKKEYALTRKQIGFVTFFGVLFWFFGAMIVKYGTIAGIFGPIASIYSFAGGVVLSWTSVLIMIKVAQLRNAQIVPGIAFGLAVATFFDGIVITWGPALYGKSYDEIALGAAWILWGAFGFLGAAFLETWRRDRQS